MRIVPSSSLQVRSHPVLFPDIPLIRILTRDPTIQVSPHPIHPVRSFVILGFSRVPRIFFFLHRKTITDDYKGPDIVHLTIFFNYGRNVARSR